MQRRTISRLVLGLLGAVVLVGGWLTLGPAQLGGSTSYALIVGNSMEPLLEKGDLAIVRRGKSYAPGDAVLYRSEALGANVLHRIESVKGDRFVLKGDNNDFVDSERPRESQIVGELSLHVPGVGLAVDWVRRPLHAALVVGLATLLAFGGGAGRGLARRRRGEGVGGRRPAGSPGRQVDLQPVLVGLGSALLVFTLLALVSFSRPTARLAALDEAYVQQGTFDYAATVPTNAVYPDGMVATGDPIFLRLVPRARFSFAYELASQFPATATGRIRLDARLTDGRGWEHRFELAPERAFRGRITRVEGSLDLRGIQRLTERMVELTGSSQASYSLTILPQVSVTGRVGDAPVDATFAPVLGFDLGDLRLQADLDGAGPGVSPLAPREAGVGTHEVANELKLAALELPVQSARMVSTIGLAATLLLGLLTLGTLRQRSRGDEPSRISARYGALLLPVTSTPREWTRVTELADMESLVRLAEHHDRMILHLFERGRHSYLVEDGGGVYRYRVATPVLRATDALPDTDESSSAEPVPGWAGR